MACKPVHLAAAASAPLLTLHPGLKSIRCLMRYAARNDAQRRTNQGRIYVLLNPQAYNHTAIISLVMS